MDPSGGRDARYNLNYSMSIGLSMADNPDMYGNPNASLGRPPSGLGPVMNRGGGGGGGGGGVGGGLMTPNSQCGNLSNNRGIKRTNSDCYDDRAIGSQSLSALEGCAGGVADVGDDGFTSLQKKSPPANGKKTKGRVKIKMEYIDNKLRRYTTFSKRKTGIMKKVSTIVIFSQFFFVITVLSFIRCRYIYIRTVNIIYIICGLVNEHSSLGCVIFMLKFRFYFRLLLANNTYS